LWAVSEPTRGEQLPGLGEQVTVVGAEQAVVTDFDEAWREDVLEEATDELSRGHRAVLELLGGGFLVRESDVPIFQLAQAVIADRDAKDVRGEILEGLFA